MTAYRRGIEDYERGRPFPAAYEKWGEKAQHSYERGRLVAAAANPPEAAEFYAKPGKRERDDD